MPVLSHAFAGLGCIRLSGGCSAGLSWLRRIFRRAFGLQLFRVKDAIVSEAAIGESLRVVFKRVGRSLSSGV